MTAMTAKNTLNGRALSPTNYKELSDEQLVLVCKDGDPVAFQYLVKRYERIVYALLYNLAPEWQDTADLAQESFIKVWRSIGSLKNPRAFRSWLTQLVTNLFYDQLRKRQRALSTVSLDQPYGDDENDNVEQDIPDGSSTPDQSYERSELAGTIRQAISTLPQEFRQALVLRDLADLSYEQIAIKTGTEMGTVKSRIARARLKVQKRLQPYLTAEAQNVETVEYEQPSSPYVIGASITKLDRNQCRQLAS